VPAHGTRALFVLHAAGDERDRDHTVHLDNGSLTRPLRRSSRGTRAAPSADIGPSRSRCCAAFPARPGTKSVAWLPRLLALRAFSESSLNCSSAGARAVWRDRPARRALDLFVSALPVLRFDHGRTGARRRRGARLSRPRPKPPPHSGQAGTAHRADGRVTVVKVAWLSCEVWAGPLQRAARRGPEPSALKRRSSATGPPQQLWRARSRSDRVTAAELLGPFLTFQSARNCSIPLSVRGCFASENRTAGGMVAMSARARRLDPCAVLRTLATGPGAMS
jgi:hypothetical protein